MVIRDFADSAREALLCCRAARKASVISKFPQQLRKFWRFKVKPYIRREGNVAILASLAITGTILGIRQVGILEPSELSAFDQMVRWSDDLGQDSRLLIVGITEEDIQSQVWPIPNQVMAEVIETLQQYEPEAIGLDIYRTRFRQNPSNCAVMPTDPGDAALAQQLQAPNVITITKLPGGGEAGIPPIPCLPETQVGFNDLPIDRDEVIRRQLLFASNEDGVFYSFSLRLALHYLEKFDITPQESELDPTHMQLGATTFVPLAPNSGNYQTLDAAGYQVMLDYRSGGRIAPEISLTDVVNNRLDPAQVKGKIVLIGSTAPSIKDVFTTPYSPIKTERFQVPGVAIHAHIVSQLLDAAFGERSLFWFWPNWAEVLWIGGWAWVGGMLAWVVRHPLALGAAGLASVGVLAGSCLVIFAHNGWVPAIAPAIALVMTGGTMVAYRGYQSQRQQQTVMRLLGQNTSPEVADALWQSRDRVLKSGKLPGQKLTATMLFTDIKDFSTISEQMRPENLLQWLNEFLSEITHEVQVHHGIVNKFTGDGLMAVFGVPMMRSSEEAIATDAQQAVACALAMGQRLQELNERWKERHLPVILIRIGIFTGPIVAGSLGGRERLEYGVIGDSVNIASRLESCEKDRQESHCRILIAQETLNYLQGKFAVEPWGLLHLKGRRHMVDVYRVLGRRTEPTPLTPSLPAPPPQSLAS